MLVHLTRRHRGRKSDVFCGELGSPLRFRDPAVLVIREVRVAY
jgi:hypothetical protein